ncbi:unnamed protein product [Plutella xylostella]|uniref:(diamondback moth) hypothetical protein n=1 Tax=Plutella xylostella TaxID=51655 RepID=A0A8S4D8P9_PLUXY|nr:unnamed protein product [Plutella xylostella]
MIVDPDHHLRESPRCLSRESSGAPRCPSSDSVYSGRSAGLGLPAALTAALPAALLPPHSAAVAAYLGAAAAAAQQRLLMSCHEDLTDPDRADALDFSTKRSESPPDDEDGDDAVNLSKTPENSPLDLSVGTRKRGPEDSPSPAPSRKSSRTEYKPSPSPWSTPVAPHLPYFAAAVAAASLSPKGGVPGDWNGKLKHGAPTPSDATKALEKMSELSRLGGEELFRSVQSAALGAGLAPNAAARHSAWQSHWLNKGADQTKDVLKCVWCKKSFNSLADLTVHMKEAKHCGVNVPVPPGSGAPLPPSLQPPSSSPSTPSHNSTSSSGSSKPSQSDLNMLIKENMPIPRKLVRGQDVWLGKGAEQTRQILKCMWCAESFRSLAEMTSHMQRTQHYTNIISQEQIISWKSSDDGKGGSAPSGGSGGAAAAPPPTGTSSHVSAVLTCKVCDQAFSSLKELSNHMVKNSHYKEHIMRSITESGGRRRQTREKRKKSLPVRKLLELERAQHEFKNGEGNGIPMGKPSRDFGAGSRITCEKCGDKIETAVFVEHIRQCIGAPMSNSQRNFLKSALMSNNIIPPDPGHVTPTGRDGRKSINEEMPSPGSAHHRSPSSVNDSSPSSKDANASNDKSSSPSVLNAIEQLIEKSFDTRSRHSVPGMPGAPSHAPIGSSILKRLGIDESVDYTKPLVDPQTMSMLRSYQHQQHYGRRERSGSESSSLSERGGRLESLTPDRKTEQSYLGTPRSTPDTRASHTPAADERATELRIKKEVQDDDEQENGVDLSGPPVRVKTEVEDDDEPPRSASVADEDVKKTIPKRESAGPSPAASPRSPASDRSTATPGDRKPASSLGALSSMFDNLAGGGSSSEGGSSRRAGSHPLAALQKLCDKTENNPSRAPPPAPSPGGPPSILTFSWACNDAVVTDSVMKCALCDTPFISKGAYRHHLSKMHFVKDGALPEPVLVKAPPPPSPGAAPPPPASPQDPRSPSQSFDESPHSKFLKYTELAKQLSSKYV